MARLTQNLPIFVFPPKLEFYMNDVTSFKGSLTVYNPYDFSLRYKLYSCDRNKYRVSGPDGVIRPHACVDILPCEDRFGNDNSTVAANWYKPMTVPSVRFFSVIRLQQPLEKYIGKSDLFRVKLFEESGRNKNPIAQKDIPATLYGSKKDSPKERAGAGERMEMLPAHDISSEPSLGSLNRQPETIDKPQGLDPLVVLIGTLCLAVLSVPYPGEDSSYLPDYYRLAPSYHIVAGFFLGMVVLHIFSKPR